MRKLILGVLAAAAISFGNTSSTQAEERWSWQQESGGRVALLCGDEVVWQFNFGEETPKPCFHPLRVPGGPVVTENAPADHPWHHGLWFAWKFINGVNYWEPDASGIPPGRTRWSNVKATTSHDGSARITMELTYAPGEEPPVLFEERLIEITPPDDSGCYALDWRCRFRAGDEPVVLDRTPPPGEPGGQPWGGYAGLSVRLNNGMADRQGTTEEGPIEFTGTTFRGRVVAFDYSGTIEGTPVGVAILDHPDNVNHPSPWYAIRGEPMGYFSPAVICYGPLELEPEESFTLRYRVLVHPDRWTPDRLQAEYRRYAAD